MRTKDQILLEEAYQKILLNNVIKESHSDKKESETDEEDMNSETETVSEDDEENQDENDDEEKKNYIKKLVKSENFIHGIQSIVEAKKKVNPYAVCTATVGRKDEAKYKSCKEKVAKGAKKSGKKVTTKKVKTKKKK